MKLRIKRKKYEISSAILDKIDFSTYGLHEAHPLALELKNNSNYIKIIIK